MEDPADSQHGAFIAINRPISTKTDGLKSDIALFYFVALVMLKSLNLLHAWVTLSHRERGSNTFLFRRLQEARTLPPFLIHYILFKHGPSRTWLILYCHLWHRRTNHRATDASQTKDCLFMFTQRHSFEGSTLNIDSTFLSFFPLLSTWNTQHQLKWYVGI